MSLSHIFLYKERILALPVVSLPPEACSGLCRPDFWGFMMQNEKGGEGRTTRALETR